MDRASHRPKCGCEWIPSNTWVPRNAPCRPVSDGGPPEVPCPVPVRAPWVPSPDSFSAPSPPAPSAAGDPPAPPAPPAPAAPPIPPVAEDGTSLTIYSSADPAGFDPQRFVAQQRAGHAPTAPWEVPGYGIVKETRTVTLVAGRGELAFTDVAEFIDPTTVSFADLGSPEGTRVLEQAFRFDLASRDKILERYLDKTIAHETRRQGPGRGARRGPRALREPGHRGARDEGRAALPVDVGPGPAAAGPARGPPHASPR